MKLYQKIARLVQAIKECQENHIDETTRLIGKQILSLCDEHLPCHLNVDHSSDNKLVFQYRDVSVKNVFSEYSVIVEPNLINGISLTVSGEDTSRIRHIFLNNLNRELT